MPDNFEDATSQSLTGAAVIQALARVMAEASDNPTKSDAVRQLVVQIEDTLGERAQPAAAQGATGAVVV